MKTKIFEPFPRAFLHVDGDSFFVACELTKRPDLKGKPVVTGLERGIASAMSYEAKARGVTRAMRLSEIKKICPDVVMIHSDFLLYEEYSRRMTAILKRYTTKVETYSVDECFADISGLDIQMGMTYAEIAARIQRDLESELGITFSVGVSITKTLAKIASGFQKPSGLTIVPGPEIDTFLNQVPIGDVWGIGNRTADKFRKWGIITALQFVIKDADWIKKFFSKPHVEIHQELQGIKIFSINDGERRDYLSTSKTRTFAKPSSDESYVYSQLSRNVELACKALRSRGMFGKKVSLFLKTQKFTYEMTEFQLPYAAATPKEMMKYIREHFYALFQKGVVYRATGITVSQLSRVQANTLNLFAEDVVMKTTNALYDSFDTINNKYGRETIYLGSSMRAVKHAVSESIPQDRLRFGKRLGLPMLGIVT